MDRRERGSYMDWETDSSGDLETGSCTDWVTDSFTGGEVEIYTD